MTIPFLELVGVVTGMQQVLQTGLQMNGQQDLHPPRVLSGVLPHHPLLLMIGVLHLPLPLQHKAGIHNHHL